MTMDNPIQEIYIKIRGLGLRGGMEFTSEVPPKNNLYKILVATILSQNTNDKNSIRAFRRLEEIIGITPSNILNANEMDVAEAIKIGGLHNIKASKIKMATKIIMQKFGGDLGKIINMDYEEARETLLKIPGIGQKTADIILMKAGHPAFPVDTHITRITKRLGLVNNKAGYEEISNVWRRALPPTIYINAHLDLIAFGRKICKSIRPRCQKCPLTEECKYYGEKYGEESKTK